MINPIASMTQEQLQQLVRDIERDIAAYEVEVRLRFIELEASRYAARRELERRTPTATPLKTSPT
jgi:hypothetical protein